MRVRVLIGGLVVLGATFAAQQAIGPRQQPGATVHIFAPEQHDLYDGHFVISANRIYMVGRLNDPEGWDHLDNEARNVSPVAGSAEIDVDEIQNRGTFEARLKIPEGDLVFVMDKWHEFSPCQPPAVRKRSRCGGRRHTAERQRPDTVAPLGRAGRRTQEVWNV